jgi:DNA-binding transcriptional MocR family regulator
MKKKISIAPGPIFSRKDEYRSFVRLNCGYPWSERFEQAFTTLGELARKMKE